MKNKEMIINIESFKKLLKLLFIKSQGKKLYLKADFEKEIDLEKLVENVEEKN